MRAGRPEWTAALLSLCLGLSILLCPLPAQAGAVRTERLTIDGSTTVLPLMQKVLEAFMREHDSENLSVSLSGGGTSNGIKSLIEGGVSIAMASRAVKSKEVALARKNHVELVEHVIAMDVILPVVHPENPVKSLTLEQLRDIFSGRIRNWKTVGGKDSPIIVVSRDSSSGTYETWQSIVMGRDKVFAGALMQASSGAVLYTIGNNRRSISYEGMAYLNDKIKALAVNGVEASDQTALDGTYPLSRTLQLYTNGQPTGIIKEFIDFTLSERGRELVEKTGLIRVRTNSTAHTSVPGSARKISDNDIASPNKPVESPPDGSSGERTK